MVVFLFRALPLPLHLPAGTCNDVTETPVFSRPRAFVLCCINGTCLIMAMEMKVEYGGCAKVALALWRLLPPFLGGGARVTNLCILRRRV